MRKMYEMELLGEKEINVRWLESVRQQSYGVQEFRPKVMKSPIERCLRIRLGIWGLHDLIIRMSYFQHAFL